MEIITQDGKRSAEEVESQPLKKPKRKYTLKPKISDLPEFPLEIWIIIIQQSGGLFEQMKCVLKLMTLNKSILFSLRGTDPFWAQWWQSTFDNLFPCALSFYRYFYNINKFHITLKNDWEKDVCNQQNLTTIWNQLVDVDVPSNDLIHTVSAYELTAITFQLQQILEIPILQKSHCHHSDIIFKKCPIKGEPGESNLNVHYYKSRKYQSDSLRKLDFPSAVQDPVQEIWDPEEFGKQSPNPYYIDDVPSQSDPDISLFLARNQYQILYSANYPTKMLAILPDYCQWPYSKLYDLKNWENLRARARNSLCCKSTNCNGILPAIQVGIMDESCECTERDKAQRQFGNLDDLRDGFFKLRKGTSNDPKAFAHIVSVKQPDGSKRFCSGMVYNPPVGRSFKGTKEDLDVIIIPSTCKSFDSRFVKKNLLDFIPRMLESLLMIKHEPTMGSEQFRDWVEKAFESLSFFVLYPSRTYAAQLDVSLKPFISRFHHLFHSLCKKLSPSKIDAHGISSTKHDLPHICLINNKNEFLEVFRKKISKDAKGSLRYDLMDYHQCIVSELHSDVLFGVNSQVYPSEIEKKSNHFFEIIKRWREWQQLEFNELNKPFPPESWINLPCKSYYLKDGNCRTIDHALADMIHLYGTVTKYLQSNQDEEEIDVEVIISEHENDVEIIDIESTN